LADRNIRTNGVGEDAELEDEHQLSHESDGRERVAVGTGEGEVEGQSIRATHEHSTELIDLDEVDREVRLADVEGLNAGRTAAEVLRGKYAPEPRSSDVGKRQTSRSHRVGLQTATNERRFLGPAVGSGDRNSDALVEDLASSLIATRSEELEQGIGTRRTRCGVCIQDPAEEEVALRTGAGEEEGERND